MKKRIALLLVGCVGSVFAAPLFEGKDGLVMIESESTSSSEGQWDKTTSVVDYTGECYLEFTGNSPNSGPATSPLKYHFTVDMDGIYQLQIRAHKRLMGDDGKKARGDQCNDCYIRLDGDFESGNVAPLAVLKKNTKVFVHGKSAESWDWARNLDYHDEASGKSGKPDIRYKLKKGEKYTLIISGRSQRFSMDRIVISHESVGSAKALDPKQPESPSGRK